MQKQCLSQEIKYLIEGILQSKTPPSQGKLAAQNVGAAVLPAGFAVYLAMHKNDKGLNHFQQLRDFYKSKGMSEDNILTKMNNPAINTALTKLEDTAKLGALENSEKYGEQAKALNKGLTASKDDVAKAHELVTKAKADPNIMSTDAVAAHKNVFGQQIAAKAATGPGHAIELDKVHSIANNLNPAMIASGATTSLGLLAAGHLAKKGMQKYQQLRYGIKPPEDKRTKSQKAFDLTHTVGRSLAGKAVSVATGAATIGGLGLMAASGVAPLAAVGGAILGSGAATTAVGLGAGLAASLKFNKANMALKKKIESGRAKNLQLKDINDQIAKVTQDKSIVPVTRNQQLHNLYQQRQEINRMPNNANK